MLCHARRNAKSILLPDFLVPSLLNYRTNSSASAITRDTKVGSKYDRDKLAALPVDHRRPIELYTNIIERVTALHSEVRMSVPDENIDAFNTAAGELRNALRSGDILEASQHWSSLEKKGLLHILGPSRMDGYSKLIAALCPINSPDTHWQKEAAEKIALGAAIVANATAALSSCMLYNLKRSDPDAALELYRRYVEGLKEKLDNEDNEDAKQDLQGGLLLPPPDKSIAYNSGRSTVLLVAITAHAMKESFPDALSAYVQTKIRIPDPILKTTLGVFSSDLVLITRVKKYVRQLEISRLLVRPSTLKLHIDNLLNKLAIEHIEHLYNAILEGLAEPGAYLATSAGAVTASKPVSITETSWGYFLTAFLRCRRIDLAEKLWDDIIMHKIVPGVALWTALFDGYDSLDKVEETLEGWQTMLSQGVKPNAFTYRSLISVLCTARRPDEALKSLKDFEEGSANGSISSDNPLPLYNTAIHGLLTNSRDGDAATILRRMQEDGPPPDLVTYNTFLRYYGRRRNFKALGLTLQRLASDGLTGDAYTFTTILSALLKAGRQDAEEITFDLVKKQNIAPGVGFYTAIIDSQMRLQDSRNLKTALNILKRMEQDPEVQMNAVPYTSILAGIYRTHWVEPKVADECREYVLSRMKERNIHPNRVTYHILIAACLENRESEGLQNVLTLYREMRKRRIAMSNDTWYILLRGLIDRREWALANDMVIDLMRIKDVKPVGATLGLVNRIRQQAARRM